MRHRIAALSAASLFAFTGASAGAQQPSGNAASCLSNHMSVSATYLRLNQGESQKVTVTGFGVPKPATPASTATPKTLLYVNGLSIPITVGGQRIPAGSTVTVQESPAPTAMPTPTPAPPAPVTLSPAGLGGGNADITATIPDPRIATIASAAPTTAPVAAGTAPAVTYTIKGERPGKTQLAASQGTECALVALDVRPPAKRFQISTGFASSSLPLDTFTSQTVAPSPTPLPNTTPLPPQNPVPGTYIYRGERSGSQTFIPLLAHYRVTDFTSLANFYVTAGLATNSDKDKQLYGISFGSDDFLLTVGIHSGRFDQLTPGIARDANGNGFIPYGSPIPTTFTSRTARPFFSLTFPPSALTDIFAKVK